MAERTDSDFDFDAEFGDSGDENSFDGFEIEEEDAGEVQDDSDVDFGGLESDEDRVSSPESEAEDEERAEEDEVWTNQLNDFRTPDFVLPSGMSIPLPAEPKEVDIFSAFVGDDLIDLMVAETNHYARQRLSTLPRRLEKFTEVTREEMRAYIGINIIMGMVRLPSIASYWSTDDFFANTGIKKVMSKNRFEELTCFLHFNDSAQEPARAAPNFDRLYKVRPIINYIKGKLKLNYNPTKNISVDEGMIPYRGRISFRQYMPAKPTKYGIKVWMAADSSNGFVLDFNFYLGKEAGPALIHGLGYRVVTKLIQPFMNRNHHIFFDNYFTSTRLMEHLESQQTFACGTVRINRKGIPPCAKQKLKPGEKVMQQKGNLVFTKWHDKRDVCLLSTNISPLEGDVMVQRQGKNGERIQIAKPAVVSLYNSHMGGVDLSDQLRKYYSIGRSSCKWYRYLFWYLMDISICNSYILLNELRLELGKTKLNQMTFRTALAKQFIGGFSTHSSKTAAGKRKKIEDSSLFPGNAGKHFIEKIHGRKKECVQCKKRGRNTPKDRPIESSYECLQCGVTLCK
ncbi:MAG: hypothetical protein DSY43_05900, partial [Gammaproteobacteria bacterium]